ncbi:hypothetical protein QFC22_002267 [Naganishia vaughanmartiniae]|uniref:Uncharacterized protein n=1 Tax=Naganishia vaughanmartiniae TaxID=1424756 RepID=A0ACC2XEG1_9TREE|nr:hypothetical protein QFC22_002267 [Naganishia vaughanmartiniae]
MSDSLFPKGSTSHDRPSWTVERHSDLNIPRRQQHPDVPNTTDQRSRFKEEIDPANDFVPPKQTRFEGKSLNLIRPGDGRVNHPETVAGFNISGTSYRGAERMSDITSRPLLMQSASSPVVSIPSWADSARSPTYVRNSPALQAKLIVTHRISPIDASRGSNHPYSKSLGPVHGRGPASASNIKPASPEPHSSGIASSSSGLRDSPRRKPRPEFPTSPRSISRRNEEDYGVGSPYDYAHTPSILRVPMTPYANEVGMASPILPIIPSSAGPVMSRRGSTGLPVSSMRDRSPPRGISRGNSGKAERPNAIPRGQPKTDVIPRSYVLKSLNNLAAHFWNRSATADCRIIIPVKNPGQLTPSPSTLAIFHSPAIASSPRFHPNYASVPDVGMSQASPPSATNTFGASAPHVPMSSSRSPTEAELNKGPKFLTFFLHRDYLVTQSTLFQKLLDPSHNVTSAPVPMPATADPSMSSFPERNGSSQTVRNVGTGGQPVTPGTSTIRINGAKVLTTTPGTLTTVWLPLPDPKSFGVLAHWLYWGDSSHLEEALARGHVSWQGLIKNIEYLELDNRIKRVLGSWWRRWVKVTPGRRTSAAGVAAATASQQRRKRSMNAAYSEAISDDEEEGDLPFEDPLSRVDARAASPALTPLRSGSASVTERFNELGTKNAGAATEDTIEVAKMMDGLRPSF